MKKKFIDSYKEAKIRYLKTGKRQIIWVGSKKGGFKLIKKPYIDLLK